MTKTSTYTLADPGGGRTLWFFNAQNAFFSFFSSFAINFQSNFDINMVKINDAYNDFYFNL